MSVATNSYLVSSRGMSNFLFVEADNPQDAIASFVNDMGLGGQNIEIEIYSANLDILAIKGEFISNETIDV